MLVPDNVRPTEQTTAYMAAHGCHRIVCSLCLLIVIIESFLTQAILYKTGHVDLSSIFSFSHPVYSLPFENFQGHDKADHTPRHEYRDRGPVGRKRRTFVHQRAEGVVERGEWKRLNERLEDLWEALR